MKLARRVMYFIVGAASCLAGMSAAADDDPIQAEVIVLSTLHQLHDDIPGYSFRDLSAVIEGLRPDVLAVELAAEDLGSRREQSVKQEYQRSVFPLLDEHGYAVVPLEPPQPMYGELVGLMRRAQVGLREQEPARAETFDTYMTSLFELLRERWRSPADVNSPTTDALFESKHRFQGALFGPDESRAWEEWNQYFLEQVLGAARKNPGKRLLVLVGAEHAYWLRKQLRGSDVQLLDTCRLLAGIGN